MENPFLTPPQVESPQSRSWGLGFTFGFQGPEFSSMTAAEIQSEDVDAFNQGVLAGQDSAINGLPLSNPCVDLHAEHPHLPHLALEIPEAITWVVDLGEGLAGGIAGSVFFALNLSIALETFTDDPGQRLAQAASDVQQQLQNMGFNEPLELFIGGGVDITAAGCELQLTPIYRRQDTAVEAASGMGRPHWLVASWRTNQSGGATVVTTSD